MLRDAEQFRSSVEMMLFGLWQNLDFMQTSPQCDACHYLLNVHEICKFAFSLSQSLDEIFSIQNASHVKSRFARFVKGLDQKVFFTICFFCLYCKQIHQKSKTIYCSQSEKKLNAS
jgi:hypothetical protein